MRRWLAGELAERYRGVEMIRVCAELKPVRGRPGSNSIKSDGAVSTWIVPGLRVRAPRRPGASLVLV
jgi:hypothetical protein